MKDQTPKDERDGDWTAANELPCRTNGVPGVPWPSSEI
jgi:hypothetical protein